MMKNQMRWLAVMALLGTVAVILGGCGHWYPGYSFRNTDEAEFGRSSAVQGMPQRLSGDLSAEDDWSELFPGSEGGF